MRKRIKEILKEGKKFKTDYFNLYYKKSKICRIGFLGGKKSGKPVKRSRIKRIMRETIRKYFKNGDFIIVLKNCNVEERKILEKLYELLEKV